MFDSYTQSSEYDDKVAKETRRTGRALTKVAMLVNASPNALAREVKVTMDRLFVFFLVAICAGNKAKLMLRWIIDWMSVHFERWS